MDTRLGCTQYKVGYEVHKVGYEVGVASNTRSEIWWEYELQYGGYEKKVRIQSNTNFSFENKVVHLVTRIFCCSAPLGTFGVVSLNTKSDASVKMMPISTNMRAPTY